MSGLREREASALWELSFEFLYFFKRKGSFIMMGSLPCFPLHSFPPSFSRLLLYYSKFSRDAASPCTTILYLASHVDSLMTFHLQ